MTQETSNQPAASSDVFVSYASQDAAVANSIVESLESQGLRCWMAPRDVKPGAQYADAIVRAINEAKAVVLVMSASAVVSSHVGKEIERASSKRKHIIAFRIDTAPLNHALEYFLSESQWIDVLELGMTVALVKLKEAMGQGSVASSRAASPGGRPDGVRKRLVVAAAVVIVVGVSVAAGLHFWTPNRSGAQPASVRVSGPGVSGAPNVGIPEKSVAVLPFVDLSEAKDKEYFADGMSEEIIDLLTKIPGLTVIGRTSSFEFKGRNEDVRTIGAKLNAAYVLEGSVRNSGDQLRISAQLINSKTGAHECPRSVV
jgi:TolB-like protein